MLLLAFACSDYEVEKQGPGPGFDTGTTGFTLDTDSGSTTVDTVETATTTETCAPRSFPGEALAVDDTCQSAPAVGTFTPVEEWSVDTFSVEPDSQDVMSTPIVISITDDDGDGDADEDDIPDVLFPTYPGIDWYGEGVLRALSGDDGHELWSAAGEGLGGSSGLAAADLDGDHFPEIVGVTTTLSLIAFSADGSVLWTSSPLRDVTAASTPAIADMDGDGSPEIVLGGNVEDADGDLVVSWSGSSGNGNGYASSSFPVDLDDDGVMEVVAGAAVFDFDGSVRWDALDATPAVGDLDGDGVPEIIATWAGYIYVYDLDGTQRWKTSATGISSGPPTLADYDGDGLPEIGVAGHSTYAVLDGDGTVLWNNTTVDPSSGVTGSAVFDFEGDGVAEAVYADELNVWAFSGPDGATKFETADHTSWTVIEYAPIVDVDGDGEAEIVVPNCQNPSYGTARHGVHVLGDADHSWRAGRKIWNQHAYHITNIEDDGSVPVHETPNWSLYNNFRSGDLTAATGSAGVNLTVRIVDTCTDECGAGTLRAWVQVGNDGLMDVSADTTLRAELETSTGWTTAMDVVVSGPVPSGAWLDAVELVLSGVPADISALRVTVDPDDAVQECDEADNGDTLRDALCDG